MYHLISTYCPKITVLMKVKILTPQFIAKLLYSLFESIGDETFTTSKPPVSSIKIEPIVGGLKPRSISLISGYSMKLELIADKVARKNCLKKRKKTLLKKVQEISILCDVDACAIIYGADESCPEVWPSSKEATQLLMRFQDMPEMEQKRKMINHKEFLDQKMKKLVDQLRKQEFDNKEMEMKLKLYEALRTGNFNELNGEQATILSMMIETNLNKIFEKMDALNKHQATSALQQIDGVLAQEGWNYEIGGVNSLTRENILGEEEKDTLSRQEQMMDMMIQTYQPPIGGPTNPWLYSFFPFN